MGRGIHIFETPEWTGPCGGSGNREREGMGGDKKGGGCPKCLENIGKIFWGRYESPE